MADRLTPEEALIELSRRRIDSVRMFRPAPGTQEDFFRCGKSEILLRGGNRCLPGWQEIYDPAAKRSRRIDSIDGGFNVWSRDPNTGARIAAEAGKPFIKGYEDFYEWRLSNGETFTATLCHQVLCDDVSWHALRDLYQPSRTHAESVPRILASTADVCLPAFPRDVRNSLPGTLHSLIALQSSSVSPVRVVSRKPVGKHNVWDFTVESTANYELAGIVHHNSGKTVCSATRFAAIARDMDVQTKDGSFIPARLPHQREKPLTMWVVGYDLAHIGQTIYRVLFRAGLYKIILDPVTAQWRAFDPTNPYDAENEDKTKPAPPLIPASAIDHEEATAGFSWENKGEKQFSACYLKNGTIIYAYPSTGEVKAGDPVDVIWIDEKIKYPKHYPEWQARLSDRKGRMFWSSWPARDNAALREVSRRAKEAANNPSSMDSVADFTLQFSNNPFIDGREKAKRIAGWSEDERTARDRGEFALDSLKMYHTFSQHIHSAYGEDPAADDALAAVLRSQSGQPPADWTRYMILDPGTAHPAILVAAVPPPEIYGNFVVPYGEIYIPRLDADALAKEFSRRFRGEVFETFIADPCASRQTPVGFGMTVATNYSRAFREHQVSCRQTGHSFTPGSDDVLSRIGLLLSWMVIQSDGRPKLRIVRHRCPVLCRQLEEYEKHEHDGVIEEKPAPRQQIDMAVCLEYLASRQPRYVSRPMHIPQRRSAAFHAFQSMNQKSGSRESRQIQCGTDMAIRS